MEKGSVLVTGLVAALLAAFVWAGWTNWQWRRTRTQVPQTLARRASHGARAPEFALEDLNGRVVRLSDYRGKAILVNFWATWCGPCRMETPWLIELRNKYASEGFEVIGISAEGDDLKPGDVAGLERERRAVRQFADRMRIPYPILIGGDSITGLYGGVDSLPSSFYLNKAGEIVAVEPGVISKNEIETKIRKALGE